MIIDYSSDWWIFEAKDDVYIISNMETMLALMLFEFLNDSHLSRSCTSL